MGKWSLSLLISIREHHSNQTAGTLFSNSRLVSHYQQLPFSTFWALRSWRLGLARIKPALNASLSVMILNHVPDVLQLRRRKNAPLLLPDVLLLLHLPPSSRQLWLLRILRP